MNKRFVWNFEFNSQTPLKIPDLENIESEDCLWEARFFWPESEIIVVNGLNDTFLNLSRYLSKNKIDTYFLLPNTDHNLKIRKDELFYKPTLAKTKRMICYGKKMKLDNLESIDLPDLDKTNVQTLLVELKNQGKKIHLDKETLTYSFETTPSIKIEFAKIHVGPLAYFSFCVISGSENLTQSFAKQLVGDAMATDYVTFLKQIINNEPE